MDWPPQVTWELGPGTPCEPVNKTKPCASYKWTGCSSIKIQPAVEVPKSLEINPCNLSRCPKSRKSSPDTGVNRPLYYTHTCRLFITVIPSAPVDWISRTFSHGKKKSTHSKSAHAAWKLMIVVRVVVVVVVVTGHETIMDFQIQNLLIGKGLSPRAAAGPTVFFPGLCTFHCKVCTLLVQHFWICTTQITHIIGEFCFMKCT